MAIMRKAKGEAAAGKKTALPRKPAFGGKPGPDEKEKPKFSWKDQKAAKKPTGKWKDKKVTGNGSVNGKDDSKSNGHFKGKSRQAPNDEEDGYTEVPASYDPDTAPPATKTNSIPLGTRTKVVKGTKSFGFDFDSDSDAGGASHGDDDEDDGAGMDLTSALSGGGKRKGSSRFMEVDSDDDDEDEDEIMTSKASKRTGSNFEDILGIQAKAGPSKPAVSQSAEATIKRKTSDKPQSRPAPADVDEESDDDEEIEALMGKKMKRDGERAAVKAAGKEKGKSGSGGGSWHTMGLSPPLLRSLLLRGYKTPTPIQRASIPHAIATPPRDLVGMARTGSGKTLAYMIPLLQKLGGKHSTRFGPRAIVLCPGRELAMQILKVGKEMGRGFKPGRGRNNNNNDDEDEQKNHGGVGQESLRWGLVVGGESLDEQFSMIASNPDVIIATPGRLLHLIVEMNLDLRSVDYVVFDEADRLFEMGFEVQLTEILHRLPATRQSLLFSATLPKTLVEFAKAGLVNPKLIRLDAESKISSDLQMAFFSVKPAEKEAALLGLLKEVVKAPIDVVAANKDDEPHEDSDDEDGRKFKKRKFARFPKTTASHQAIIFTATKHHVEYLTILLRTAGYTTSHIYGSLDQTARKQQMDKFRRGETSLLVVTDVAARGIDIPVLEHVINYDFPTGARIFVHRVGRTARAGRKGWAWSFITNTELPFLLDLQLFLGKPLVTPKSAERNAQGAADNTNQLILGTIPRDTLDADTEYIATSLREAAPHLVPLKDVVRKGQAMYERSQGKASQESYRRAKSMMKDEEWGLAGSPNELSSTHPVFAHVQLNGGVNVSGTLAAQPDVMRARAALLAKVNSFTPVETVFEVGTRGKTPGAQIMQDRRRELAVIKKKQSVPKPKPAESDDETIEAEEGDVEMEDGGVVAEPQEMADEEELEVSFTRGRSIPNKIQVTDFFLPSHPFFRRPPSRFPSRRKRTAIEMSNSTCRTTSLERLPIEDTLFEMVLRSSSRRETLHSTLQVMTELLRVLNERVSSPGTVSRRSSSRVMV